MKFRVIFAFHASLPIYVLVEQSLTKIEECRENRTQRSRGDEDEGSPALEGLGDREDSGEEGVEAIFRHDDLSFDQNVQVYLVTKSCGNVGCRSAVASINCGGKPNSARPKLNPRTPASLSVPRAN